MSSGICKVILEFEVTGKSISGSPLKADTQTNTSSSLAKISKNVPKKLKSESNKPTLSIINQNHSRFSSFTTCSSKSEAVSAQKDNFNSELKKKGNSTGKQGKKNISKSVKRRKQVVYSSDSDSEVLAFGTDEPPAKKAIFSKSKSKPHGTVSSSNTHVGNGDDPENTYANKKNPCIQKTADDRNEIKNTVICDDDFESDFST